MSRSLLVFLSLVLFHSADAHAQWFGKRARGARLSRISPEPLPRVPNNYQTPYPTSTGRMSIGVFSYPDYNYPRPGSFDPYRFDSYVYDPYRFGSFEAPDLLNDPYFRERHRYDSHFPGRRPAPLVMRTTSPEFSHPSPRNPWLYQGDAEQLRARPLSDSASRSGLGSMPLGSVERRGAVQSGPEQLLRSLSAREDGQAWIEFLAPGHVNEVIQRGDVTEIRELLSHYDGIVNNSNLRSIVTAPGFQDTRALLQRQVQQSEELGPAIGDEQEYELLPPKQI